MISKIFRTIASLVAASAAVSLLAPVQLHAQTTPSLVTNRLTQPIDESSRITLKGMVHPLANARNDRGAAPDSMPLDRIQIVLKRSTDQEAALEQLIRDQHTPGSANYHKWLTPEQFGQQFGPSDQDIATLESWLASKGFSVDKLNPGRQTLEISGNVAQLRAAFNTQIHKYMVNGETHYANATDPQIPSALAPVFGGFVSLNNFQVKHYSHFLGKATYDKTTGRATPQWTYANSENLVLAPGDFATQYDLNPLYTAGINGTGQTIAIINESNINVALVQQFRTLFNIAPVTNVPQVIIDGNDPGIDGINNPDGPNDASIEAYLDVEWAGAVAPDATVDLVIAADTALESGLVLAAERAVYSNIAPIMSLSFGSCEQSLGSGNAYLNNLYEQAAAQGITVMVSSGDSGSAGCDDDNSQYFAVNGLAVNGWGSTPYNVAVGGTDFYYANGTSDLPTYWNQTPTQSPAVSIIKAPIPEQPWDDSQYGLNLVNYYTQIGGSQSTTIAGGGGGASSCATGSGASCAGYAKPSWQTGTGVPADKVRDVPDVSLFAADGLNYTYYPICASDGDCQPASGSSPSQISGVGGTSAAAPSFAGIMALVNQEYGRQGQADFVLYPLATQFPAAFHDVTAGTNTEPCAYSSTSSTLTLPTPNCNSVTSPITVTDPTYGLATEGKLSGYAATAGYDQASGLGSVDANVLVTDWNKVTFTGTTVTLTSPTANQTFTHGQSVTFSGTVAESGGTGTPAGSVAIETSSTEQGQQSQGFPGFYANGSASTLPLTNGAFSGSISTLPGGTYNVWANYGGDGTNGSGASTPTQITVSPEASSIYFSILDSATANGYGPVFTPPTGPTNIPYGTQLILSAQVVPTSQLTAFENCQTSSAACPVFTYPTGTIAFADNGSTINTAAINTEGDAEFNAPWSVGMHSATASYAGDSSYNASTASAITFSVVKDTPQMNLTTTITTSGALVGGQQMVLTALLLNSANLANENTYMVGYSAPATPPTGSVTISGLPSGVPTSATISPGVDPQTLAPVGIATIAIPANTATGTYNVTVSYGGDTNYTSTSQAASIPIQSVSGLASTTTATVTGSISPATTVTISGTVTGQSGHPAPSNANGGVMIYSSGYYFIVSLVQGSGDSSTFSTTVNSQSLLQGTNAITVQFLGDATYAPSADVITTPISNPLSDFSMVPGTTIVPVTAGSSGTDTIQLASVNGFTGTVNYTCTAASGITCTLNPTSNTFTSGGTTTMTATINAGSSTANGSYNVLITGTGPSSLFVHTLGLQAVVSASSSTSPTFTLMNSGASPAGVTAGSSITSTITATPANSFTGTVNLTCAVAGPAGGSSLPTCTFNSNSVDITSAAPVTSALTISTTSGTTSGDYTATVTGMSGSLTETTAVSFTVTAAPSAGFSLGSIPAVTVSGPGATGTSTLTVTPTGGFTGNVNFICAITTSPSGATNLPTCSAPAADITGTGAATSTLTVTTTAATSGALRRPLDKFFAAGGGAVVAALLFFGIPARRRGWRALFVVLLFAGIAGFGIGCGGGSSSGGGGGGGSSGTTTGTYTATVTATDAATGKITQMGTVNITVN